MSTAQLVYAVVALLTVSFFIVSMLIRSSIPRFFDNETSTIRESLNVPPRQPSEHPNRSDDQDVPDSDVAMRDQLRAARAELQILREEMESDERRYRLLREYAAQGLSQSRLSFRASLAAAGSGFVIIVSGVVFAALGTSFSQSVVPVISGSVIETVSLLFFTQDRRNQQAMFEFFERLRQDRKLDESLAILRGISEEPLKSRIQATLTLHFAGFADIGGILGPSFPEVPVHHAVRVSADSDVPGG